MTELCDLTDIPPARDDTERLANLEVLLRNMRTDVTYAHRQIEPLVDRGPWERTPQTNRARRCRDALARVLDALADVPTLILIGYVGLVNVL